MRLTPLEFMRCFVAIPILEPVSDSLVDLDLPSRGIRPVPSGNHHITLKFLDHVEEDEIETIGETLRVLEVAPFSLALEGVGLFPTRGHAKVLWVGLGTAHPHLYQLKKRIEDALIPLDFEPETRSYQPHVTVARSEGVSQEVLRQWVKKHQEWKGPAFRVERFCLYRSEPYEESVRYIELASFPLAADRPA